MTARHSVLTALSSALLLLPGFALAQDADAGATSEPAEVIDIPADEPLPLPIMDGRGGGGGYIAPPYPGSPGGVLVDASVTKDITPDYLSLNAFCDIVRRDNRDELRLELQRIYNELKTAVGKDGRVRRAGNISIYPFYDPTGRDTNTFSGNMSIFIRILNPQAAQRISDAVESKGCSSNWDVRLVDTLTHERSVLDTLKTRIDQRKEVFETLLNTRLTRILSVALYTSVDSYGSYDPETNTVTATTTLTMTYDLGQNASVQPSSTSTTGTKRTRTPRG